MRDKAVLMVQTDPHTRAQGAGAYRGLNWMRDYAAGVIAERRANPQNDLISHFSTAEIDGDKLDEREVLLTTTTLIMARHRIARRIHVDARLQHGRFRRRARACVKNPDLLADAPSRKACVSTRRRSASAAASSRIRNCTARR